MRSQNLLPPVITLLTFVVAPTVSAGIIGLEFDTLPSAQGFTYFNDGNPVPESDIFSVNGTTLTQDSIAQPIGPAANNSYRFLNSVDAAIPFTLEARVRVIDVEPEDGILGFFLAVEESDFRAHVFFGTDSIAFSAGGANATEVDVTVFHDYRIEGTPGESTFDFYVDNVLIASPDFLTGIDRNYVGLGDPSGGANARVEITEFVFTQVPEPKSAILALIAGILACWRRTWNRLAGQERRTRGLDLFACRANFAGSPTWFGVFDDASMGTQPMIRFSAASTGKLRRLLSPLSRSRTSVAQHRLGVLRSLCLAPVVSLALATTASATPIASLPNLVSVTIWESTGAPAPNTFSVAGPELTTLLLDPLSSANNDFTGSAIEFYDVFYSDANGNFDPVGTHLTVTALFDAPGQSGGNISEVRLNFAGGTTLFGDVVTAFVTQGVVGVEAFPGLVTNAVDRDLQTTTFMGQTQGADGRLSITVGFTTIPEPGTATLLLACGFLSCLHAGARNRFRSKIVR